MCMPNYWIAILCALIIVSSKYLPKEKIIICLIVHGLPDPFSLFISKLFLMSVDENTNLYISVWLYTYSSFHQNNQSDVNCSLVTV